MRDDENGLGGAGLWSEQMPALAIPATVVDVRPVQEDEPYHAAGLRFRELSPEVKGELRAFLTSLLVA